ncbi:MAG: glycosyltransferase family 39 protein, partial [Candidatus Kapaibacterium sp.]
MNKLAETGLSVQDRIWILAIAIANIAIHLVFINNYGIFRDELYYLACADRLAWGYVDQPPLVALIARAVTSTLGDSLWAVRLPAVLAGTATVYLSGWLALRLGAGRIGAMIAAIATMLGPFDLFIFHIYSMNAFEALFWTILIYIFIKIIHTKRETLWLWFGGMLGIALMNKYSAGFLAFFLLAGMLFTPMRRQFLRPKFWLGMLIALAIFTPHIIWQINNDFPTLEFMANARARKMAAFGPLEYFVQQALMAGPLAYLLVLGGTIYFIISKKLREYLPIPLAYILLLGFFIITGGKPYYIAPVFPAMFALGGRWIQDIFIKYHLPKLRYAALALALAAGVITAPMTLPVLPPEQFVAYQKSLGLRAESGEKNALGELPQTFADMFGWREMARKVSDIYMTIDPELRSKTIVAARNYGEAGAMEYFAREYPLPPPASTHNNYWIWGLP